MGRLRLINTSGDEKKVMLSDAQAISIQRVSNGWVFSTMDSTSATEISVFDFSDVLELMEIFLSNFGYTIKGSGHVPEV